MSKPSHAVKALQRFGVVGVAHSDASRGIGAPSSRRSRLAALLSLAVLLALAFTVAPAFAKEAHVFAPPPVGEVGTANGQLELRTQSGVAVNQETSSIYVADTGNGRVEQFESSGAFARVFGSLTTPTFIAVDNSAGGEGDIYVADSATNRVYKFEADGAPVTAWGESGSIDGSSAPGGPFGELAGIAVDSSGNLWVYNTSSEMFEFAPGGSFEQEWNSGRGVTPAGIAVDPSGDLYVGTEVVGITKFTPAGTEIGDVDDSFSNITGLAVDPATGELYVDDSGERIRRYAASCETGCSAEETFGQGEIGSGQGLAIAAGHSLYVADAAASQIDVFKSATLADATTTPATVPHPEQAILNGEVNPLSVPLDECFFEYGPTTAYGQTADCESPDAAEVGAGATTVAVHADLSGIASGNTHFRLVVKNEAGFSRGADEVAAISGPPILVSESASPGFADAELKATINPGNLPTTYRFEYGESTAYGRSTAPATISPGESGVEVSAVASNLAPNVLYHFRLVASNEAGGRVSVDHTFVYSTFAGLPDGRGYELVTPVEKSARIQEGGYIATTPTFLGASSDGNNVFFQTSVPLPGSQTGQQDARIDSRSGAGWSSLSLEPAESLFTTPTQVAAAYGLAASTTLSDALIASTASLNAADLHTEGAELYLRRADGTFEWISRGLIGQSSPGPSLFTANLYVPGLNIAAYGASADLDHVVFGWPSALLPSAEAIQPGDSALYERSDGTTGLVDVDNAGELLSTCGASTGGSGVPGGHILGDVSRNGSRIFFEDPGASSCEEGGQEVAPQLYVRESGEKTVEISRPAEGVVDPNGPQEARFAGSTPDGEVVFFTDHQALTPNANTGPQGSSAELYSYNVATGALTALSTSSDPAGAQLDGEPGLGLVGFSEDGSLVYFVGAGQIDGQGIEGAHNLYLSAHGQVRYIGTLGNSTYDHEISAEQRTASITPDGAHLLFQSTRDLTAYESHGFSDVYEYDASTNKVTCISCNPGGTAPSGNSLQSAFAPVAFQGSISHMSSDGAKAFFESEERLVPQDTNGVLDVYEFHDGAVSLLSSGTGPYPSRLFGATPSGADVFFGTNDMLAPQDIDGGQWDIYDARVGGGFPVVANQTCEGEGCRAEVGAAPTGLRVGSAGAIGLGGNIKHNGASKKRHKKRHRKRAHKPSHTGKHHKHKSVGAPNKHSKSGNARLAVYGPDPVKQMPNQSGMGVSGR